MYNKIFHIDTLKDSDFSFSRKITVAGKKNFLAVS